LNRVASAATSAAASRPSRKLLEVQDLIALELRQSFSGHAVLTAKVAAVGNGDAEVCDQPSMSVHQRLAFHQLRLGPPT
jgi:hypothetical protein